MVEWYVWRQDSPSQSVAQLLVKENLEYPATEKSWLIYRLISFVAMRLRAFCTNTHGLRRGLPYTAAPQLRAD
jgi:hypothetical protein